MRGQRVEVGDKLSENVEVQDMALDAKGRDAYATHPYDEGHEGGMPPVREQGYDDREDESIGARVGHKNSSQSWMSRRNESYGKWGNRHNKGIHK